MEKRSLLLDRYKILDTLGEGGFSKVVRALDTKMEREVAIKIIAASRKTAVRALREAKTVALLNHPNIVTLHEFEEQEDHYYLIMEHVQGRSVADILDKFQSMPPELAMAITLSVLEALECAHTNDVIHRDIKPANLRVMEDGRVKVMDFGIARLRSAAKSSGITTDGEIVGTFAYMSPEQSRGEQIDERSDIFSVGVLLYEMITGRLPFEADTPAGTIYKIVNEDPEPPATLKTSVPQALSQVILKALAKSPDDRFDSATAMKSAVDSCRQSAETPATVIQSMLGKLRAPRKIQGLGPLAVLRARIRYWVDEYEDTIVVTSMAAGCAAVAAWSSTYLPFIDTPIKLLAPILIFFSALFIPPLGLAAVLGLIVAGLWQISIYLGGAALALALVYWITLGRGFPQFAILPLLVPVAAWLKLPFLFPLAVGVAFGPIMAGFLVGVGALLLATAELMGQVNYAWMIAAKPELIANVRFDGELTDLQMFASYFTDQTWLGAQILIWVAVGVLMGAVRTLKTELAQWLALGVGAVSLFLAYRLTAGVLKPEYDIDSLVTEPLVLSVAALAVLMFIFVDPTRQSR